MTENPSPDNAPQPPAGPTRPRGRPTLGSRPGFWPTAALAAACFLLLFELLAFQLRRGEDPALGGAIQAVPPKPPRPVLVRRIVQTRVVPDAGAAPAGVVTSSAGSSGSSSGSAGSASVAPAAPAPAPAPAAPVVSSSS